MDHHIAHTEKRIEGRPPYLMGLLCLIPLVGALVGIALILYGIFKYKDKILIAIGVFGVVFTVVVYASLFYNLEHGKSAGEQFAKIAQLDLNSLAPDIEFYKIQNGAYPDSLDELRRDNKFIVITDPLLVRKMDKNRLDSNRYTLYSVGIDGIPHTADDIYPSVGQDSSKFGLVRRMPPRRP